jgi:hypothetical protein
MMDVLPQTECMRDIVMTRVKNLVLSIWFGLIEMIIIWLWFTGQNFANPRRRGMNEWIPVSERLPEPDICVWTAHKETIYSEMMLYQMDGGWEWYSGHKIQVLEPTHWMLPPDPPEVRDE